MSRAIPKTVFVGNGTNNNNFEERLRVPKGRQRDYLFIQNQSANDIYVNFGSHATIQQGFVLGSGLFYERDKGVPQDDVYVNGSQAGPQQVGIVEGFVEHSKTML